MPVPPPLPVSPATVPMPIAAELLTVFAVGVCVGGLVNWAIYSLAWWPRPISPWAPPHPDAPPRRASDRLPVVGWWGLRRESPLHGRGFWVRPLLIELGLGVGLAGLYHYETTGGLLPAAFQMGAETVAQMQLLFIAHAVLIALLTAATFIDFDEQTIPDSITIPGALVGLAMAAASTDFLLPARIRGPVGGLEPMLFTMPAAWDPKWNGAAGLGLGLALFAGWCFALADRRLILRHGVPKALRYFAAGLVRHWTWKMLVGLWVVGSLAIMAVWAVGGERHWPGLLTGLVGMAGGGAIVWSVRLVAGAALGKEAMGFGDVTLMAMIGALLGWQAALIAFFLAPVAAVGIVLVQWILTRERAVAFGPYLSVGAVIAILGWDPIWNGYATFLFDLGVLIPAVLVVCLLAMGGMLGLWRAIESRLFGAR